MANLQPLLNLQPFSPQEIGRNNKEVPIVPDDVLQLATDSINVEEGRVLLSSFDPEYQKLIRNFYRFSCTRYTSAELKVAKRTLDTLDIV
jgi:hypothetical protein